MTRALFCGSALALMIGFAAQAQNAPPPTTPSQEPSTPSQEPGQGQEVNPAPAMPPGTDASAVASVFKPGMIVKDSAGATVGTVEQVGQTADGSTAIEVSVDGKAINLSPSILAVSGDGEEAVSSMTKAQIKAASDAAR
ncbi:hypothetical protein [Caulobacter sp. LARHSG274]